MTKELSEKAAILFAHGSKVRHGHLTPDMDREWWLERADEMTQGHAAPYVSAARECADHVRESLAREVK